MALSHKEKVILCCLLLAHISFEQLLKSLFHIISLRQFVRNSQAEYVYHTFPEDLLLIYISYTTQGLEAGDNTKSTASPP